MKPTAYMFWGNNGEAKLSQCPSTAQIKHDTTIPLYAIPTDKDGNPTHKIVPIEPTEEMIIDGGIASMPLFDIVNEQVKATFIAMVKSAPEIEDI